jgi:hypothetical protein
MEKLAYGLIMTQYQPILKLFEARMQYPTKGRPLGKPLPETGATDALASPFLTFQTLFLFPISRDTIQFPMTYVACL